MKRLPLHRRPLLARTVLEVGGGHDPYQGVTHAVDKFPQDNSQRAGSLNVSEGVEFREGDLESIPYRELFDFIYVSHVFEHVTDAEKAAAEINRVARRGYLETPSPLREQLSCPHPFDAASDFHHFFCWTHPGQPNALHVVRKSAERLGEFCGCPNGKMAKAIFDRSRRSAENLEAMLPGVAKTTRLYFRAPFTLFIHSGFQEACQAGGCAYHSVSQVRKWTSFPLRLVSPRFQDLHGLLMLS